MTQAIDTIAVRGVTKIFNDVRALSGVSFQINRGEVVAVMGANGAGKSTLLSLLSLRVRPTRGEILFNGVNARGMTTNIAGQIGLLSHASMLYGDLTARENLQLFATLSHLPKPAARIAEVEDMFGLQEFSQSRAVRVLSRGQTQRVALASAILRQPELLLLDEPASGLDIGAIARIEAVLRGFVAEGKMAILVTHEPELAARVASRAIMLRKGRVVMDGPMKTDVEGWRQRYLEAVGEGA